jgi:hypothetical protein
MTTQIATFRTEAACDIPRAKELLKTLSVEIASEKTIDDANMPSYKMGLFHIKMPTDMTVGDLASKIEQLTVSDERFVDLHRCYQTLRLGDTPKF